MPPPEKGADGRDWPVLVSPLKVLFPLFATHTSPEPSIAMLDGELKFPLLKLAKEAPSGAICVTLAPVEFVTQASPERSMAMADGPESDPPVYPPAGDSAAPSGENSLTLFAEFDTQTFPVASTATPVGPPRPPPVW